MKLSLTSLAISLAIFIQPVQADLSSVGEQIMNDAQHVFPNFFPSSQKTETLSPYLYRYYPASGIYLGINQDDEGVYLLGGSFGDTPVYVDNIENVQSLLKSKMGIAGEASQQKMMCNTSHIPSGFNYIQEGNNTYIDTNTQCLELLQGTNICEPLPEMEDNGKIIATGIHTLSKTTTSSFESSGIDFPGFTALAQQAVDKTMCIIHAPADFSHHTVNIDVCMDITSQLGAFLAFPGVTPPVTTKFQGTSNAVVVDDCFNTNASSISNIVTQERWENQEGNFVKVK